MLGHPTPGCFHIPSDQETHPAAVVDFLKRQTFPPFHTHTHTETDSLKTTHGPGESLRASILMTKPSKTDVRPSRVSKKRDSSTINKDSRRGRRKQQEPAGRRSPNLPDRQKRLLKSGHFNKNYHVIHFKNQSNLQLPSVSSASRRRRNQSLMLSLAGSRAVEEQLRPGGGRRGGWPPSAS